MSKQTSSFCGRTLPSPFTRRQMLLQSGAGFGALAATSLLGERALGLSKHPTPQLLQRAKSVIFLFMEGGPSHLDTFDPKPLLNELAGQQIPESFGEVILPMGEFRSPLLESKRTWAQHGEAGTWVSNWLPYTAQCVDDIAVLRGCWAEGINHSSGVCQMNTCSIVGGRPSLGSWVSYGLGSENQNLPAYVVMQDQKNSVVNGPRNWSAGFMPAKYQGTRFFQQEGVAVPNLNSNQSIPRAHLRERLDYLNQLNRQFANQHPEESELEARIASYEMAYRMQVEAPDAVDLSEETESTQALYGMNQKETATYGKLCLMSRRLVERGVRFVQIYSGAGSEWDAHSRIESNHTKLCKEVDQPVAALLKDLKQRGLLEETLVIWGGEFGRTPMSEKGDGRDHNPTGFTMWMAGGGVKGGQVIGNTDELGLRAIEDRMHVSDIHASILYLLGIDNMELTYLRQGRPERPTINEGAMNMKLLG